jgi:hypothetical protein
MRRGRVLRAVVGADALEIVTRSRAGECTNSPTMRTRQASRA